MNPHVKALNRVSRELMRGAESAQHFLLIRDAFSWIISCAKKESGPSRLSARVV